MTAPERRVQVTVTLDLGRTADECDAASFLGDVREALEGNAARLWLRHPGALVGLVAEVPGDDTTVYRVPTRLPGRTITT